MRGSPEKLAVAFVEATTEYDFAPLPDAVKDVLIHAARVLINHIDPVVIEANEVRQEIES